MDVAIAPAHGAERRPHISADGIENGFAKSEPSGGIADKRRKDVAFLEGNTEGGTEGFLAASEENATVDFTGAIKRGKFIVEHTRQQHETKRRQINVPL